MLSLEPLRNQQQLSGRFSAFEIAMGLCRFSERIGFVNTQFQLTFSDSTENFSSAQFEFFTSSRVVSKCWARDEE